jgi:hypothetical protein
MKNIVCSIFLACAGLAAAAERPGDFAYGMALEVSGKEALYEITLPAAVYRGLVRADLGDLRVFNGAGEVVPHAFRPRRTVRAEALAVASLTLFPLKARPGAKIEGLSIRVRRSDRGATSIDVTDANSGANAAERRTIGYLIDASALDHPLRAIEFDWQQVAEGFTAKLRVDASDDLAAWRTLVAGAPLVSLEVGGQRLEQKRVELPQQKAKYLRLSWAAQDAALPAPPEIVTARGELAEKAAEAPRAWARIDGSRGQKPGEYQFDTRGRYPVDRVRFDLPQSNTVVQIELLTRDKADQAWRRVARGVVYRLRQGESEVTSPDLVVAGSADRYWLLRVDQRGGGLGGGDPVMHVGWVPHTLVFAARGEPPFQLAYGSREAKPVAYSIEALIPNYRDEAGAQIRAAKTATQRTVSVAAAQALEQTELGGESRREEAIDWKRWSLWGALVLGVLVLAAMAWRLLRQLNASAATKPDGAEKR